MYLDYKEDQAGIPKCTARNYRLSGVKFSLRASDVAEIPIFRSNYLRIETSFVSIRFRFVCVVCVTDSLCSFIEVDLLLIH